jgi:hypothetical protein
MTTVLYVGGWGRSGSTLLDRLLGQVPAVTSLGEVREIWQRSCVEDRPCGCSLPFSQCPFWTEVGRTAFGGWGSLDLPEVLRLRYRLDRAWTPAVLAASRLRPLVRAGLDRYLGILGSLYGALSEVSGTTVLVDSSKLPSHALLLRRVPGVDLRLLHLVRDSRGVAFSWQKETKAVDAAGDGRSRYLNRYGTISASARYVLYNEMTRLVGSLRVPYLRLRYEDLVADPRAGLTRTLRHAGLDPGAADLGFLGDGEADLHPNHTVDGNPVRFAVGPVRLRADDEWRRRMASSDRRSVTALTSPLLLAYGYPLGVPKPGILPAAHPSGKDDRR